MADMMRGRTGARGHDGATGLTGLTGPQGQPGVCLAHSGMVEAQEETKRTLDKWDARFWQLLIGISATAFLTLINLFVSAMKIARAG